MNNATQVTQPKRPIAAAVIAASLPLLGSPLAMAFMFVGLECGADDKDCLVYAWQDGGWGMYWVAASLSVIGIVSCVLAFFAVARGSNWLLAALPLSAVMIAEGSGMSLVGLQKTIEAVQSVLPRDRPIIMLVGLGESLTTSLFGFASAAAMWTLLALVCVIGFLVQSGTARRVIGIIGGVFLLLAVASLISMVRLGTLVKVSDTLASISRIDRPFMSLTAPNELGFNVGLMMAIAFLAILIAFAVVQLKSMPRLRILLPVIGLSGLWGHGAFALSMTRATIMIDELFRETSGRATEPVACLDATGLVSCENRSPLSIMALGTKLATSFKEGVSTASVRVFPDASPSGLWAFADTALANHMEQIELLGDDELLDTTPSLEFALVARLFRRASRIEVGIVENECAGSCTRASTRNGELVVESKVSDLGEPLDATDDVLLAVDRSWTQKEVVDFALVAAEKNRRLVLALGTPALPFRRQEGRGD